MSKPSPQVSLVMGSKNDGDIANLAVQVLDQFNVSYEVGIKSAHRTPERMLSYAHSLQARGLKVVIALAGGSAHLPGMIASSTELPVLAVPVKRDHHNDEALKSSIAMPSGIPLAVFPNNGADRAALFAVRILSLSDNQLHLNYLKYIEDMKSQVIEQDALLENLGWNSYFDQNK